LASLFLLWWAPVGVCRPSNGVMRPTLTAESKLVQSIS